MGLIQRHAFRDAKHAGNCRLLSFQVGIHFLGKLTQVGLCKLPPNLIENADLQKLPAAQQ